MNFCKRVILEEGTLNSPKPELHSDCNCFRIMPTHKNASAPSARADFQNKRQRHLASVGKTSRFNFRSLRRDPDASDLSDVSWARQRKTILYVCVSFSMKRRLKNGLKWFRHTSCAFLRIPLYQHGPTWRNENSRPNSKKVHPPEVAQLAQNKFQRAQKSTQHGLNVGIPQMQRLFSGAKKTHTHNGCGLGCMGNLIYEHDKIMCCCSLCVTGFLWVG